MQLQRGTAISITLSAIILAVVMLRGISSYLMNGFMRAYMDADNWDYLLARFGVARLPLEFRDAHKLEGPGQLDRDDVVFVMEIHVCQSGLSVCTQPFGRLVMPWHSVQMLRRRQLSTGRGPTNAVSVILDGPESFLCVPWSSELDGLVPKSVGIN